MRMQEDVGVSYSGSVPKAAIAKVYDDWDVLLMIIPSSKCVTAGKVYEHMASGTSAFAVHEPSTGDRIPLEGYPLAALLVDGVEPRAVADAILKAARMARDLDSADVASAKEHARRYTRAAQLTSLEQELRGLARG